MLTELQRWFADQLPNRRLYPRRRGPFRAWLQTGDSWKPLIGVDISPGGIGIMSLEPLPWGDSMFAAEIRDRRIEFRAQSIWVQEGTLETKRVWRGGFRAASVSADGWRTILEFCNESLPPEERVTDPPVLRIPQDDIERLLPQTLRERVVALLLEDNRVTSVGSAPNVQYQYGGVVHHGDGLFHKIAVASRAIDASNRVHSFETAFYFNDELDDVRMDGESA